MNALSLVEQARRAKAAALRYQLQDATVRRNLLMSLAEDLLQAEERVLAVNEAEVTEQASRGIDAALLDRLALTPTRLNDMAEGVRQIADMPDELGHEIAGWCLPNGLQVQQVRVPLGVVGMIYEARPNVTVDAAVLSLKTGNAVLLRGSSQAYRTNGVLVELIQSCLERASLPRETVQLVQDLRREAVGEMSRLRGLLDVIIPRGGANLIQTVLEQATVPVIETGVGNCHLYIDNSAPFEMAAEIAENGKCSRPAVCNALETILVHRDWAARHFSQLAERLVAQGVELRCCPALLRYYPQALVATESDWHAEFLSLKVAIKGVSGIDEALEHIKQYGSHHSEAILTLEQANAERFMQEVDAACIYHNASTRFSDGYALGMGAEIGISTQKLHARGPMGIAALTTYKTLVRGQGQSRS